MNVIKFPVRPRHASCCSCGRKFTPTQVWHQRCQTCWGWLVAGLALRRSELALRAVRH